MATLPPFAPFPSTELRAQLVPDEWAACLDAWVSLAESHLSLSDAGISAKDESVTRFLTTFIGETASGGATILGTSEPARTLLKDSYLLTSKLLHSPSPPGDLAQWTFLSDLSKTYGKKRSSTLLASLPKPALTLLDASLTGLKKSLIKNLDAGINGDIKSVEERLLRLNPLIHSSPHVASFFLAGSDFLDGLVSCYKVMNPPLRKAIVTTTYLSLVGLVDGAKPRFSLLTDQLYSLKAAADAHKAGPTSGNDSLVAELVTVTPFLQQVEHKLESSGTTTSRAKAVLRDLAAYRKAGGMARPKRLVKRKVDKGKGRMDQAMAQQDIHVHRMSQITQVQDLFPELGSGFVAKLLDEYGDDPEQVIAHLLDDSLPSHFQSADRSEQLYVYPVQFSKAHTLTSTCSSSNPVPHSHLPPRPTPPQLPARHSVYDEDEIANLALDTSRLHIGKRNAKATADALLRDTAAKPTKSSILAALAAFDSDDDERDDTYDAADVGGAVVLDSISAEDVPLISAGAEEALYRVYLADKSAFGREAATRRGDARMRLKEETGMTDEAVEGWGVMYERDAGMRRRLELRFGGEKGHFGRQGQREIAPTSWRAGEEESGEEGGSSGVGMGRGCGFGGRGRGRGGPGPGRGRGRGDVAGPTGDKDTEAARRRKEASKGSRANHNRRDQRARKMARGGFPG
ncbi:hypothetical protein GE09DRAFT_1175749 [Coniochaeta sp. 2T2.1]|nr:hypothetical protein GE09DRAFT_1175749 [Coniochaeta sp. 2T2.1]